jgi:hypothetical protein
LRVSASLTEICSRACCCCCAFAARASRRAVLSRRGGGSPRTCRPRHLRTVPAQPFSGCRSASRRPLCAEARGIGIADPCARTPALPPAGPFHDAFRFTLRYRFPESAGPASPATLPVYPKAGRAECRTGARYGDEKTYRTLILLGFDSRFFQPPPFAKTLRPDIATHIQTTRQKGSFRVMISQYSQFHLRFPDGICPKKTGISPACVVLRFR